MIDIVITCELPQRELENAILLQSKFIKEGYTCDIVYYPFENPISLRRKYFNNVRCVMAHSLYDELVLYNLVYSIFGKVEYVINSQYEQIFDNKVESNLESYWFPKGIAKNAIHLCWGRKQRSLLKASGVPSNNAVVVGPIHLDFLRHSFKSYGYNKYDLKKKYNIDEKSKTLLFISSFSYVAIDASGRENLIRKLGKETVENFEKITVETQIELLNWFESFLSEHTDYQIIYRKHPDEKITDRVYELANKNTNFKIISDFSVRQWITTSDIILVWYSTSIVEAYFSRKKYFILRPYEMPKQDEVVTMNGAKHITNYKMFCESIISEAYLPTNETTILDYYDVTDIPTYIRIYNLISEILEKHVNTFVWDERILHEFEQKLVKEIMINIIVSVKIFIADVLIKICRKTRIAMPHILEKKISRRLAEIKKIEEKKKHIAIFLNNKQKIEKII